MTAMLLGCQLSAKASGNPSPAVMAKLNCDAEFPRGAEISYELRLPGSDWGEVGRTVDEYGFVHFETQSPFPLKPGSHRLQVLGHLKWNEGQADSMQDVDWVSSGDAGQ